MKTTPSLMEAPVVATPILDQFKKALTPSSGKEPTLEDKLSTLSEPSTVLPAFVVLPEVILNVSANAVDAVRAVINVIDNGFSMRIVLSFFTIL